MQIDIHTAQAPGLVRRLAAVVYDCLVLAALLILAAALVVLPLGLGLGIDGARVAAHPLFRLYLLLVIVGFFCGFWLRGGQTLGMRAWRIMLVRNNGGHARLRDALSFHDIAAAFDPAVHEQSVPAVQFDDLLLRQI